MAIAQEIEAKLLVPRLGELEQIATRRRLLSCRLVPRRRAQLETTYLDTAELALLSAGVCLRVRRDGNRHEATAKWMGAVRDGVHARPELTVDLPSPAARSSTAGIELPAGPLRDQLAALVAGRALSPILVTHIDRRVIDVVRRGQVVAELALDRVRSEGPRARKRTTTRVDYGELELELRAGTLAELEALADVLRREHALEPTHETKFSRGMAQVYGAGVLTGRAAAFEPPGPSDTVGQALRKALGAQLVRIRAHDPGTRAGDDPEAVHQQRVGVRRARAVLHALGDVLPPRHHAWLGRELRWLGRTLGVVRDLDVQLLGCEQLGQALGALLAHERGALQAHVDELRAQRACARELLLQALDGQRYYELLLELEALCAERDAHVAGPGRAALLAVEGHTRAQHALAALRRRGREVATHPRQASTEALHDLRIRARRTRYLLEVLAELTGAPGRRVVKQLVRLQDCLGEHQDATVAAAAIAAHRERLGAVGSADARGGLERLAARERRRAERARRSFATAFRRFDGAWGDAERMLAKMAAAAEQKTRGGPS